MYHTKHTRNTLFHISDHLLSRKNKDDQLAKVKWIFLSFCILKWFGHLMHVPLPSFLLFYVQYISLSPFPSFFFSGYLVMSSGCNSCASSVSCVMSKALRSEASSFKCCFKTRKRSLFSNRGHVSDAMSLMTSSIAGAKHWRNWSKAASFSGLA